MANWAEQRISPLLSPIYIPVSNAEDVELPMALILAVALMLAETA